jgi:hypothetical protein
MLVGMKPAGSDRLRRFLIWMAVAAVLIVAGFVYAKLTFRSFEAHSRETLREWQRAGTLPRAWQGIDVDTVNIWDLGMQLRAPPGWETRLQIAQLLADFRYVWMAVVLAVCLGAAALPARRRKRAE